MLSLDVEYDVSPKKLTCVSVYALVAAQANAWCEWPPTLRTDISFCSRLRPSRRSGLSRRSFPSLMGQSVPLKQHASLVADCPPWLAILCLFLPSSCAVTVVRKPFLLYSATVLMSHTVLKELSIWFCLEYSIFGVQTDYSRILLSSFFHLISLVAHSRHCEPYYLSFFNRTAYMDCPALASTNQLCKSLVLQVVEV